MRNLKKPIKGKQITEFSVRDPDSKAIVHITVIKLETGGMIGIDSSFLSNTDEPVYSPFDKNIEIDLED